MKKTPFPYLQRYDTSRPLELMQKLQNLGQAHIQIITNKQGLPVEIDISHDIYDYCDKITDFYTEEARMKAFTAKNMSPLSFWQQKEPLIRAICYRRHRDCSLQHLRETMYFHGKEATLYKASLTKVLCDLFCPQGGVYFDPFAGWGDRMLGALASQKVGKYIGVDSNPNLYAGYQKILQDFDPKHTRAQFINCPIEDYVIDSNSVDFILTSPPYYDYETYDVEKPKPAYYKSYQTWFAQWMGPVLCRLERILKPGGILILYVGSTHRCPSFPDDVLKSVKMPLLTEIKRINAARLGRTFVFQKGLPVQSDFQLPLSEVQK
jgi:DNA modification methylase